MPAADVTFLGMCVETQGATQKLGGTCLSPACTGIPVKKGMLYTHGIVLFLSEVFDICVT